MRVISYIIQGKVGNGPKIPKLAVSYRKIAPRLLVMLGSSMATIFVIVFFFYFSFFTILSESLERYYVMGIRPPPRYILPKAFKSYLINDS